MSIRHFLLLVKGKDRPGILAAVTQVLYIAGCNLEDCSVAHSGGEFALLVRFSGPDALSEETVEKALERVGAELELKFEVKPLEGKDARPPKAKGKMALISVHGPDRPGLLFRLSSALAKLKVNLTELNTYRMAESRHEPGAVLFLEVELAPKMDGEQLKKKLAALGKELGVSVSVKGVRGGH